MLMRIIMNKKSETMQNQKSFKRKYILAAVIALFVLAGYFYKVVTWSPVNSESKKASEAIIRYTGTFAR